MVLSNVAESAAEQAYNDAPSSDSDPYSEASGMPRYNIDTSKFPQPVPIFGALWGFTPKMRDKFTVAQVEMTHKELGRYPTQEEAEAFTYIASKHISTLSYYPPIGLAAGAWRSYQTSATFRFPLVQPDLEKFSPEEFPSSRWPLLRGYRAVIAWHSFRTVAHMGAGLFFSGFLITSYAASVSSAEVLRDPRLKDIVKAVKESARQKMTALQKDREQRRKAGQQQPPRSTNVQEDDTSPTGGVWGGDSKEENIGEAAAKSPPTIAPRPWPKIRPVPIESRTEDSEDQPFDAFDDASPTGGQGMLGDTESSSRQQTGSAWERIRRGERPIPNSQQQSQSAWSKQQDMARNTRNENSSSGDSFTFSKSVEERSYAQEEAQREFDAKVERERRGGDFSQNGGDQKRW